jgi:hypothetical protein
MATFRDPLTERIVSFLREIGLSVTAQRITHHTVLPGIDVEHGGLVVDDDRLAWPCDLLHEAGHLAVAEPAKRASLHHNVGDDGAEEMMAIAWSYAAALHIGIDPALVFHDAYRGGGPAILEAMRNGGIGVPMLGYAQMTYYDRVAPPGAIPFPHMIRWLREAAPSESCTHG